MTNGRTATGERITDALIEELSRKAEAGYEVEEMAAGTGRPHRPIVESESGPIGVEDARYPDRVTYRLPSTTPTAEKPALSEAQRIERLRQLAKRLRRPDGLDRDALKHIEQLTGDEQ
jgi:hypothetical protein